jgi:hypothetical protein
MEKPMNASKENADKAKKKLTTLFLLIAAGDDEEQMMAQDAYAFLEEFLKKAAKKLPTEEAFVADQRRKRQKTKPTTE